MKTNGFKLPSKHIRSNKKQRTLTVAKTHYYDNLPENLTKQVVDDVHEWDDIYLAAAIEKGAKEAKKFKKGKATLTVHMPTQTCSATFDENEDPLVVIQTDYGTDTQVGLTLSKLMKVADQKVS